MAIKIKPKSFLKTTNIIEKDSEEDNVLNNSRTTTSNTIIHESVNNTDNIENKNNDKMIYNGVYLIENTITGKKYVGSSSNIDRRIKNHIQHLEKGCHNNRKLQKDHDIHGIKSFNFVILEKDVSHDLLTAYEKYWIYKHDAIVKYKGYNEKMPTLNHSAFQYVCKLKQEQEN